jgi:hypothetical protein
VTHDQEEGLTMSDRIAVMSQGRVEQVGSPKDIYENPATAYVADFLGVSNLMDAEAGRARGRGVRGEAGDVRAHRRAGEPDLRGPCKVTIRPSGSTSSRRGTAGENRIPGMVERVVYVGATLQVFLHLASGQTIQAWIRTTGTPSRAVGRRDRRAFPVDALRVLAVGGTAVLESGRARGRERLLIATAARSPRPARLAAVEPLVEDQAAGDHQQRGDQHRRRRGVHLRRRGRASGRVDLLRERLAVGAARERVHGHEVVDRVREHERDARQDRRREQRQQDASDRLSRRGPRSIAASSYSGPIDSSARAR